MPAGSPGTQGLLDAGPRREALKSFLTEVVLPNYPLLPYDKHAADWHAHERARLQQSGAPRPFVDGQIASIAATRGLVLVTRNVRDFTGFRELEVHNWHPLD